jgi:hypothetical protein
MGRWAADYVGGILKPLAAVAMIGLVALGLTQQVAAGPTFTGQFGDGNTWNVYESISTPFTFKQALAFAATRSDPTGGSAVGHLLTVQSVNENNTAHTMGGGGDRWIGLSDRVGVAPGASESAFDISVYNDGWEWVTGEPFNLIDPVTDESDPPGVTIHGLWGRDGAGTLTEPNNAAPSEDGVHIRGDSRWNDNASGFGVNDPVEDTITFDSPQEGEASFGFIIEWDTELPAMPPGFPGNRPDPGLPRLFPAPLARLPGPNGTATTWGSRDVTGLGNSAGTRAAIADVLSGMGTEFTGQLTLFDIADPQTNNPPVGNITGPTVPFVSNTAADDNGFQTVVKGTIEVPAGQGGPYTFAVRSDDGFALRIISQPTGGSLTQHKFTAARTGIIDEDGTLAFLAPTGDSNTAGVVNLPAGTYDVEFVLFEDGGGAFAEVSTQKGDWVTMSSATTIPQWILLGDPSTRAAGDRPFKQAVRLTGPATVKNRARGTITNVAQIVADWRTNPPPTAEGMVDDVILNGDGGTGIHGGNVPDLVHQFPNGTGVDQFTTAVNGQLTVIDTDGAAGETLTFGMFADDNAGLHILGQSFTAVGGAPQTALGNPEGMTDQWLLGDFRTGNTNSLGLITLAEGNYDFESFMLEEGGGAVLELWVSTGNQLAAGFDATKFFPLTIDVAPTLLAANQGLGLVVGPGTGPSGGGGIPGDHNNDGKVDTADYVVWRKSNINGQQGYNDWRTNYGRTSGSGSALGSAVPEPASALLVALGLVGGALVSRRRAG